MDTISYKMKKPVFVLKNIKPSEIDKKYNLSVYQKTVEPFLETGSDEPKATNDACRTRITDLSLSENDDMSHFSFLDESKKDHQCVVTMKSFLTNEDFPPSTGVHCFWCRHGFTFRPIGCPIDYISDRMTKTYHSEITKDVYTLRENVTRSQLEQTRENIVQQQENANHIKNDYKVQDRNYYLMDGLFCSFNCCLAFVKGNSRNVLYIHSENYLTKIYYDVFGPESSPLVPAPSWRLLKDYGGHMSIEEYRKNFYKVDYFSVDNIIVPFPNSKPVGFLFEKQVKL